MCEAAGLADGWMLPCSDADEDGPCRYHQGAADMLAALERWASATEARHPEAMSVARGQRTALLRAYAEGVAVGMREAAQQVALWAVQAGANR